MRRMYHQYFGLSEAPFSIAVNPRYLFMSARHRDALAHLLYGVGAGGGFILLTGEVGTGKTTINRCLLEQLPDATDIAIILNPALNAIELLASVCDELGIDYPAESCTLKVLTDKLHQYLLQNHARGRKTVLMIDEAQHLDFDVLEQIRLLTNLETNSEKLLQIILIGQPELAQLLARPELRQLNQRITARYNLGPLNLTETRAYIQHRLQVAGMAADRELFPPAVVRGVYQRTRGIPRLINVLCDRILLGAYGRNKSRADKATLQQAAREVLGEEGTPAKALWPRLLALVVLIAAGLFAWLWYSGNPFLTGAALPAGAAAVEARPELPAPDAAAVKPAAPDAAVATPPAVATPTPLATGTAAEQSAAAAPWLQPPADAAAQLWALASAEPFPGELCAESPAGLACVEGRAQTWSELAALRRPLLLDVITPERFAAGVVLLDIQGRRGWVATHGGAEEIDLSSLAPLWRGAYRYLWRAPPGYSRPLAQGDEGPVVAQVARLFAELDGQREPLAGSRFNTALQRRVRLFQEAHGLEDDGVVGVQTLLELNRALGIDPSAEQARQVLLARAGDAAQADQGGAL